MAEVINLLVTSGSGPEECRIAVRYLVDEMQKQAIRNGLVLHELQDKDAGSYPKSIVVTLTGEGAGRFAGAYVGSVKLVFKSPVRPNHKRQNWFVGVDRLDDQALGVDAKPVSVEDVRFETLRAGGPGGQHQNTTDSAVRAIHLPTGLTTVARDDRSQHRNKALALQRLSGMLKLIAEEAYEKGKRDVFMTHKSLERGNAVLTLKR